ncbi:MAG: MAB_1171c family putative transporter [Mycobacteriales bacterium]
MAGVALVLTWVAVLFKAPGAWRAKGAPARRALWVALFALALGWTMRVPRGYHALDEHLGVPNLAQPVGDGLALATGCAILGMLLYQSNDAVTAGRKLRFRVAALVAAVGVMVAMFTLAGADAETNDFVARYSPERWYLVYSLAYLAYLGYVFVDLGRLCGRYSREVHRRFLRWGLRLIQVSAVLGLTYVLLRGGYLVGVRAGYSGRLHAYGAVSRVLVATLSLFAVVGASLPAAGPRVQAYRAHRQLRPLWKAMHQATPGIALTPPASQARELISFRDLRFRLHSRILEIRDGRLALRRYFRRDVAERARRKAREQGMTPQEETVTVEAATLAAAIEDKAHGRLAPDRPIAEPVPAGGADLADEVSFLRKVTRAYRRSRVVQESVQRDRP